MRENYFEHQADLLTLDPTDKRWIDFAATKPQATIFHHPAWINVLAECYGYHPFVIAVRDTSGKIVAGLPVMEVASILTGRRWVALPFTDYCIPLYDNENSLDYLTSALVSVQQGSSAPKIEIRWELPAYPEVWSNSNYVLHTVKLDSDMDLVAKGFKRTHRQNIGTAEKRGVRIEWGDQAEHLRLFYRLHLETRRKHGVPVQPWRFFELLWEKILERGLGFILLAYKDDECLASGVFLHWQHTLTYKYSASAEGSGRYRPNNLLTWTAMSWGCEHDYTLFDLGRAELDNAGLRRFKCGWGAEERPLVYSSLGAKPSALTDSKLMSFMNDVISRSPLWVCRVAGELLYRHFG
jgi:CelD/BcsL family acetyltransferase involved in cellulose biosynthesis